MSGIINVKTKTAYLPRNEFLLIWGELYCENILLKHLDKCKFKISGMTFLNFLFS